MRHQGEFVSLRLRMLGTLLFGLALAILLFLIVNLGVRRYVTTEYLSDANKLERSEKYEKDFKSYVADNSLTGADVDKIAKWARDHKYIYILVYNSKNELMFDSGEYKDKNSSEIGENKDNHDQNPSDSVENGGLAGGVLDPDGAYVQSGITVRAPSREELIDEALQNEPILIYTADGGVLKAAMADYTEYLYYDVANIASWIIAIAVFFTTMWIHFYGITKRISKLGKEVTLVAEGDATHAIAAKGSDELTRLSMDVEYMRVSMLDNLQRQKNALESNKELITAMSHDIRTPLTVLLGYLDIMKSNAADGEMKSYIEASESTALRLKKLSDDMFGYFLVYGGDIEIDIQECNARTLVEQMLSGPVFLLREQGYTIEYNFEDEGAEFLSEVVMVTDPPQLMRIVENVFSNILKYADIEKPITVHIDSFVDEMTIKVSNSPSKNPDMAQKNGIGLQSCMKLANAMDIRFSSGEEDGIFNTSMYIPIIPKIEYTESEEEIIEEKKGGFSAWLSSILEKLKGAILKSAAFIKQVCKKVAAKLVKK